MGFLIIRFLIGRLKSYITPITPYNFKALKDAFFTVVRLESRGLYINLHGHNL